ncbi:hypothetical protein AB835_03730 [Candidatus Endobugula sertula]|uniref:Uncharacterized protein n=1 Tax=Candidatus Endobugula sertula TaxID=62101 RepID=A0A1D2QS58_9GAMM|nr:hypothetical protein AB835_03730 [Candidatus Endobugula sertula]
MGPNIHLFVMNFKGFLWHELRIKIKEKVVKKSLICRFFKHVLSVEPIVAEGLFFSSFTLLFILIMRCIQGNTFYRRKVY